MTMNEDILREELAALRAEVLELRARIDHPWRLGPRPETQEDIDKRTERLVNYVEVLGVVNQTAEKKEPALCTTNGKPVEEVRANQKNATGQHDGYIVLCPDERAKGFVRPYRNRYQHVGPAICGLHVGPDGATVCKMDPKHDGECGVVTGPRPQACQSVTTMGRALSETYARNPSFYGATFCVSCNRHLPVAEFIWTADGQRVGS